MKIKFIEAFLATVSTGSIRAAARKLGLSQPAVSKAIKALEDEVGAPLMMRGTKGIDLTEYGKAFHIRATTISHESHKAIEEIRQMRGEMNGSVSILLSPAASMQLAPPVVRQFHREHPEVKIHIYEGLEASAVDKLRTGEIDFSVTSIAPTTTLSEKEFIIHPIIKIPMAIICRSDNPLKDKTTLKDLLEADWVQIGAGGYLTPLLRTFYLQHGLEPPHVAVECHSFTSSLAMIENSDMLGIVPEAWISDVFYAGKFTKISVAEGLATNQLMMLMRRDKPLIPVAQKMSTLFLRLADV